MLEFFARRVEKPVQQPRRVRPQTFFLRLGLGGVWGDCSMK